MKRKSRRKPPESDIKSKQQAQHRERLAGAGTIYWGWHQSCLVLIRGRNWWCRSPRDRQSGRKDCWKNRVLGSQSDNSGGGVRSSAGHSFGAPGPKRSGIGKKGEKFLQRGGDREKRGLGIFPLLDSRTIENFTINDENEMGRLKQKSNGRISWTFAPAVRKSSAGSSSRKHQNLIRQP